LRATFAVYRATFSREGRELGEPRPEDGGDDRIARDLTLASDTARSIGAVGRAGVAERWKDGK
jgi:hypothetical protein